MHKIVRNFGVLSPVCGWKMRIGTKGYVCACVGENDVVLCKLKEKLIYLQPTIFTEKM